MEDKLPALYTFRRCPYAIRARLMLKLLQVSVTLREVSLKDKPQAMLKISPKGTVPVLDLQHSVIDESLDIIIWALKLKSKEKAYMPESSANQQLELVKYNDTHFKKLLDGYKYPEKNKTDPEECFKLALGFFDKLESLLQSKGCLFGEQTSLADIAIFPFIRQFAKVDLNRFYDLPYPKLKKWLDSWLEDPNFLIIMQKINIWRPGDNSVRLW